MKFGHGGWGTGGWGGPSVLPGAFVISGFLRCAPVTPGTVSIHHPLATLVDDGVGNLIGDGAGAIDYRTGEYAAKINPGNSGDPIVADYMPQEGGCQCGSCKTHYFRLIVVPGSEINRNQIAVTDAFKRLIDKINKVTPIHAKWLPLVLSESVEVQVTTLFDLTPADVVILDGTGLHVEAT